VKTQLERYVASLGSEPVSEVLAQWADLMAIYLRSDLIDDQTVGLVHGDFSPANLYIKPDAIKILDWEWAGQGVPHADLAALLKRTPPEIEQQALARYAQHDPRFSPDEHRQQYEWCQLERGLMDAGYLAKQVLDASQTVSSSMPAYIERSLQRTLQAYHALA
jgi:aminoglycoside phosphotransferase (APT) family kinase protein